MQNSDEWGHRAQSDFSNVQGKRFRHEKTKKKRGSYAGGKIDPANQGGSVKFDNSDDE